MWRHRLLVLVVILATAVFVAAGVYFAPKTYTATAALSATADPAATTSADDLDALRGTIAELSDSRDVLVEVENGLDVERSLQQLRDSVSARWQQGTVNIEIQARDSDPDVAADIANLVAEVLPAHAPAPEVFTFTTSNPAQPPTTYSSPNLLLAIGVGVLLALILSACAALLVDRRTYRLADAESIEQVTAAPVLAHVAPPREPTLQAMDAGTPAADVFRRLRISMEAQASGEPASLVVVTGVVASDLSAWLAANLAISLATVGRLTLLVDGRMVDGDGRPRADEPDTAGLYEVLHGADLDQAVSPGPVPHLSVLPSGQWGVEPHADLIETAFADVMAKAVRRFDAVVVIAPSIDTYDDALIMASGGSLVLAVGEGSIGPERLRAHADRIRSVGARLLGVVLLGRRPERVPVT